MREEREGREEREEGEEKEEGEEGEEEMKEEEPTFEFFYSKSKSDGLVLGGNKKWRKYLSNFQDLPTGLQWDPLFEKILRDAKNKNVGQTINGIIKLTL